MKKFAVWLVLLTSAAACTAVEGEGPGNDEMTKAEAAQLGGKADGLDLCEWFGWYDDGICDEFCAEPDPDCEAEQTCFSSNDCDDGSHCSVDDGDCQSACPGGGICPAVCAGTCVPDAPDACWGAWVDQSGQCRAPNDGAYPQECCEDIEQPCGGLLGLACDDGEFCSFEPEQTCGAADQMGSCEPMPEICPEIFAPVCGCDGETYANECDANGAGVSIVGFGPCAPQPECTSSNQCGDGEHCTTEDGDCLSNCPPGLACPAVCWGVCEESLD